MNVQGVTCICVILFLQKLEEVVFVANKWSTFVSTLNEPSDIAGWGLKINHEYSLVAVVIDVFRLSQVTE